ncbi:MAG: radical SAM protein [Chordicoccus sp.]
MEFHGPIIRPATDADSVFIEVTAGCTHNSCSFCNFYKDTPFYMAPIEQVERDLKEAKEEFPNAKKIWASGGNPFALSAKKLIALGHLFKRYYPHAVVSTYSRIDDLFRKSVDDIRAIHESGIDDIMIGIESGDDEVLSFVNKGYTAADVVRECRKLDQAGLPYRSIYLGGLAGQGKLVESAKKSATVFNQIHPYFMYLTNVTVMPGTKLYRQRESGEFVESTEKERLMEIRELVSDLKNPIVVDSETSSSSVYFIADLPKDREALRDRLDRYIDSFSEQDEEQWKFKRAHTQYI